MNENLILLIAAVLLAALVILLIVIARLLVGVRQALAESRAKEADDEAVAPTGLEAPPDVQGAIEAATAGSVPFGETESPMAEPAPLETATAEPAGMETATAEPAGMETATAEPAAWQEPEPVVDAPYGAASYGTASEQRVEPILQPEREVAAEPEPETAPVPESTTVPTGNDPFSAPIAEVDTEIAEEPFTRPAADDDPFADTSFADGASDQVPEPADPQPYQRDGRWWFERDGELLVYDEVKGEWTPAAAEGSRSLEQAMDAPPEAEPWQPEPEPWRPETTATETSSFAESPSDAVPMDVVADAGTDVGAGEAPPAEGSLSEPQEDPFLHPLDEPHPPFEPFTAPAQEVATPAQEEIVPDEPVQAEPVQAEPVQAEGLPAEEPAVTEPAPAEDPVAVEDPAEPLPAEEPAPVASYWKCPSCGVVNGSTATSCRMCFTARP
jgi:hypothetical protein